MGFDQKGSIVISVAQGKHHKWEVSEQGFDQPLASFDTETEATAYAHDIAGKRADSRVLVDRSDVTIPG